MALAGSIVAYVLANVTTGEFFAAYIVTFRGQGSTKDRRLQECSTAGARLGLTVDDWTLFTEPQVAGISTVVFSAVQRFIAGLFTGVHFWEERVSVGAADFVAKMVATVPFSFAD